MSFFEIAFIIAMFACVLFISGGLGYLFGMNAWYFVIPVGIACFFLIRWWGNKALRKKQGQFEIKSDREE
jgi:hypothetical protein